MWFGGGGDLTPIFEDLESKEVFHQSFLKKLVINIISHITPSLRNGVMITFIYHIEMRLGVWVAFFLTIYIMIIGIMILPLSKI